jgi:hypothetical protein
MSDEEEVVVKINFKKIGIIVGTIVAVCGALAAGHNALGKHMEMYFFSVAQAGELTEQIKGIADAANKTADAAAKTASALDKHIRTEDLKEQKRKLELLNARLQDIQLWESTNRPNSVSTRTRQELLAQIEGQKEYVACLQDGKPNCVQL